MTIEQDIKKFMEEFDPKPVPKKKMTEGQKQRMMVEIMTDRFGVDSSVAIDFMFKLDLGVKRDKIDQQALNDNGIRVPVDRFLSAMRECELI